MICELCGEEGAFVRRVDRTYGKKDGRDAVAHIPIVYCPNCQQTYFTSETLLDLLYDKDGDAGERG